MSSDRMIMARAAARAAARSGLAALRARGVRRSAPEVRHTTTADGRPVVLQPVTRRTGAPHGVDVVLVRCAGRPAGRLWTRADPGTSTFEVVPRLDADGAVDALTAALRLVLDAAVAATPDVRVAVRRPLDPFVHGPGPDLLTALGLTHVATFPGDVTASQAWGGEERWELLP